MPNGGESEREWIKNNKTEGKEIDNPREAHLRERHDSGGVHGTKYLKIEAGCVGNDILV